MRPLLPILLLSLVTACASPTPQSVTLPAPTPVVAATTPAPLPTQTAAPTSTPSPLPALQWVGGITHADSTVEAIVLSFAEGNRALTIQPQRKSLPIGDLVWDGTTLNFSATGKQTLAFSGHFDGQQVTGQVTENGQSDPFVLLPMTAIADSELAAWAGPYRFETGAVLTVQISPTYSDSQLDYFWPGLSLTHFGNGAIRGLYPIAKDTFLVGGARVLGYPFVAQVTFHRDATGAVTGLAWQDRDPATGTLGASQSAQRFTLPSETVHYTSSDGIELTGLVTLPNTPGPHPAIVVLHGSEPGTRNDFFREELRTFFASEGLVVLTYDKRGVGDSGGAYVERASESNLTTLAEDSLAGVAYLKGRSEVDPNRIGLFGSSQAGWIIPIAAQKSGDVAFFVIMSGPVVSVGEETIFSSYANNGDSDTGYTAQAIATDVAVTKPKPSGFNALPILPSLKQPGLWLWGGHDLSQPVFQGQVNLEALIANGQTNFSYLIFENGDHNLQVSAKGLFKEIPYAPGFTEDFFTSLSKWLKALP